MILKFIISLAKLSCSFQAIQQNLHYYILIIAIKFRFLHKAKAGSRLVNCLLGLVSSTQLHFINGYQKP